MCKVNKETAILIKEFVHGYVAGSCVSFNQAVTVFISLLKDNFIDIKEEEVEELLSEALNDAEYFNCENCGWWCPEHDRSENGELCRDCSPDCEEF